MIACKTSSSSSEVNYSEVCNQWILRMLNSKRNTNQMAVCLEHLNLMCFDVEGNTFFESFLQAKKPGATTKYLNRKCPTCSDVTLHSKRFKSQSSAGKVYLPCFFIPRAHWLFISRIRVSPTLDKRTENQERNYMQLRRNLQKTVKWDDSVS